MLHWLKSVFCLCPIWRFPFKNSISYFNFIKHTHQWGSCHSSVNQINCLNQISAEKNMLNPPRLNDLCKKQRIQSMIQKITWTSTDMLRLCFSDAHNHTSFKSQMELNSALLIYGKLSALTSGLHSGADIKIHSPQAGIWLPTGATQH